MGDTTTRENGGDESWLNHNSKNPMNRTFLTILWAAFAPVAFSAEYSVFRVCEDKHVLRTSDGADAGHVEYIVLEPSSQRIVSTIVTGGVVGAKFVAVPFSSMQFTSEREVSLTQITRERIVSAPVIERTQLTSQTVIEPALIERTNNHYGLRAGVSAETQTTTDVRERERTAAPAGEPARGTVATPGSAPGEKMPPDASATSPRQKRAADSGSKQPGQNPPGIAEKLPDKETPAKPDAQGRRVSERAPEKAAEEQDKARRQAEKPTGREARPTEKPSQDQPVDRATEKARDQVDRAQDQSKSLKEQAERKFSPDDRTQPKSTPAKKKQETEEPRQ
jgi:hypothetical protein